MLITGHVCHETLEVRPRVGQGFHSALCFWSPIPERSLRTRDWLLCRPPVTLIPRGRCSPPTSQSTCARQALF